MSQPQLILGIDGGGTKTVACLALVKAGHREMVGRARSGPSNPRAVGTAQCQGNLDAAVEAVFLDAGRTRQEVSAACLAIAGASREPDRELLRQWATQRRVARRLKLVSDAEPLLAAGTPAGWGIALISGTGSFAFGRNEAGQDARVGGWGYLFGDEGSAYAVAVGGLRAAAWDADGRGPKTSLLPQFLEHLNIKEPAQLIEAIYRSDVDRRSVAQLAPLVLAAAVGGDSVAARLLDAAAADLAHMVDTLRRRLDLPAEALPLALAGSLLLRSDALKRRLLTNLADQGLRKPALAEVPDPVLGALTLAQHLL
jgi:N-acetylglucosamine kinase-like BadF-type ATPase